MGAQVQKVVRAGGLPPHKYIIRKQLTKRPEDYPDAQNQPHVQVALRRKAAHKGSGILPVSPVKALPAIWADFKHLGCISVRCSLAPQ